MAQCTAKKADGTLCNARATPGVEWCYNHHPDRATERVQNARRAGKASGRSRGSASTAELQAVKDQIVDLIDGLLNPPEDEKQIEVAKVWAVNALLQTKLRVIEIERKQQEIDELEARIAALEAARSDGGTLWDWGKELSDLKSSTAPTTN